jgi:hypothetical protein
MTGSVWGDSPFTTLPVPKQVQYLIRASDFGANHVTFAVIRTI